MVHVTKNNKNIVVTQYLFFYFVVVRDGTATILYIYLVIYFKNTYTNIRSNTSVKDEKGFSFQVSKQ